MSKTNAIQSRGFKKGYDDLKKRDQSAVKKAIMEILGVTTDQSFYDYKNGRRITNRIEAIEIETLFAEYGVKEVWGL